MTRLRFFLFLLFIFLSTPLVLCQTVHAVSFEMAQLDPASEMTLGTNEHLSIKISYDSDEPIRFLASALRHGEKREVGAIFSSAGLHSSGKADALAWISFANPTHIDKVVVTAYDEAWNRLDSKTVPTNIRWSGALVDSPREPTKWVLTLQKKERLKRDYMFDSEPERPETASDIIFILSLLSIPTYIFLQIRMLRRYSQRWRELATVPLVTSLPLVLYAFSVGIGFNLRLWPPFFMYFMLASCFYLLMLWAIKKIRE